jgi:hypothetical protein
MRESINDSEELKAVTPSEERHSEKARYALTYATVEMVIGASAFALLLKVYSGGPRDILCLAAGWMSGGGGLWRRDGRGGGTSFDARVFRIMYAEALQCSRRIGMIQR